MFSFSYACSGTGIPVCVVQKKTKELRCFVSSAICEIKMNLKTQVMISNSDACWNINILKFLFENSCSMAMENWRRQKVVDSLCLKHTKVTYDGSWLEICGLWYAVHSSPSSEYSSSLTKQVSSVATHIRV